MYLNIARLLYLFNNEKGINYARKIIKAHENCPVGGDCELRRQMINFVQKRGYTAYAVH